MKRWKKLIDHLGISPKTVEETDFDVTRLVVHDSFRVTNKLTNYRELAIQRLIDARIRWASECNIVFEMFKRFVSIRCPYCGCKMKVSNGTGSGLLNTTNYRCGRCKSEAYITIGEGCLGFSPSREKKI